MPCVHAAACMKTLQQIALESLKRSLSVFNVIDAFTLSQKVRFTYHDRPVPPDLGCLVVH